MQRSVIDEARGLARGRWTAILRTLGIPGEVLNGKHQPCPMCDGVDRFRYTNHQNEGRYFCSGCGPGDGFDLVAGTLMVGMGEAAREVSRVCGVVQEDDRDVFKDPDIDARRESLNKMWRSGDTTDNYQIAWDYLESRACFSPKRSDLYRDIRGSHRIYHKELQLGMPAMLAMVRDPKGYPVTLHRTYLQDGKRFERKLMPPLGELAGSAIRLGSGGDTVIVGEGIETVLSGCLHWGMPGMAAINAGLLTSIKIPREYQNVVILADNDKSFTGQAAAFTLARKLDNEGRTVEVLMPTERGLDFNDEQQNVLFWENA